MFKKNSVSRPILRGCLVLGSLALAGSVLPTLAQADLDPAPGGGYYGENTALGDGALINLDVDYGYRNTGLGNNALHALADGFENTAVGYMTLSQTDSYDNTAVGAYALCNDLEGANTAVGFASLKANTNGSGNVATGYESLMSNTTGSNNTAGGIFALLSNVTGSSDTASGCKSLFSNTSGSNDTAAGNNALYSNTTGGGNVGQGVNVLYSNTSGSDNAADGYNAMYHNTTGRYNTALGYNSLPKNSTGSTNIAIGSSAGANLTTGSNNIDLANAGVAAESGVIRIGTKGTQTSTYIAGISGVTVAGGVGVIVDTNGHLGTVTSSERFKDEIKPMDQASAAILDLQPVTFHYKPELDPEAIPQYGLVAEQVAKVNPDLVARDAEGKIYTVRYDAVNAMLLNEFLKEHRKMEQEHAKVARLEADVASLAATLKAQAAKWDAITSKQEPTK